ncbi:ribokinase [Corynebacterium sp. TAE3-ERU12]|uniref:ribokinase n=1 Tax=Corynebacterium sp. TAE3-ERU12 TaxID=2849491 RepID=UPI001C46243C|nr:ribokinase [Corynebacterium sp. TAE3-ERU12]MBV7295794.1 ribokinase [Corynebacterium sp. TAE3-ERU12]
MKRVADPVSESTTTPLVVVCGSIHLDTIVQVDQYPVPGEPAITEAGQKALGGKGANQAVACTLAGARTRLAATIGEDSAADTLLAELTSVGVDTQSVQTSWDAPTGSSFIATDRDGGPLIFVTSGANRLTDPMDHVDAIAEADILLAQGELPPTATQALASLASMHQTRFILNLAPVTVVTPGIIDSADPLVVNHEEAWRVIRELGIDTGVSRTDLESMLRALLSYCPSIVLSLSERGSVYATNELHDGDVQMWYQPAVPLPADEVVDTTGAGDAFAGVIAAELAHGADLGQAVAMGSIAGAEAVKSLSATASYADAAQLRELAAAGVLPKRMPLHQWDAGH